MFRPLDPNDKINKFEIERENDALRAFLKKAAPRFHASNIAKTYVAIETGDGQKRVRSYISILNSWIRKEYANIEDCPEAEKYLIIPPSKSRAWQPTATMRTEVSAKH